MFVVLGVATSELVLAHPGELRASHSNSLAGQRQRILLQKNARGMKSETGKEFMRVQRAKEILHVQGAQTSAQTQAMFCHLMSVDSTSVGRDVHGTDNGKYSAQPYTSHATELAPNVECGDTYGGLRPPKLERLRGGGEHDHKLQVSQDTHRGKKVKIIILTVVCNYG